MHWRRIVLGIGNPGPEYANTRHNVGFMALDRLAEDLGLTWHRLERRDPDTGAKRFSGKVKARVCEGATASGESFVLVQPLTYVNLSGNVAGPLLRAAGLPPESLFVVVDDLNLPLGRIRVRPAGSSGGHNGLESIEAALASQGYPRLRLGIGEPVGSDAVGHVLASFLPEEREVLVPVLDRAGAVLREWLDGVAVAELMGRHNGFVAGLEPTDGDGETDPQP